ncbi:MAG: hypothetical protein LBT54_04535 [Bifidobacteriaceae bacterium]|jgi:hypothetical protein|nr:hypothetical protein [Bifidobacteriaceae bacterium]
MPGVRNPHLAVLSDRVAVGWVLENQRIAFPEPRYKHQFRRFVVDDTLYLYTTRGCFKNPAQDQGRIVGKATLTEDMVTAEHPVAFLERTMPYEAPIRVDLLAPVGEGVPLAGLADRLSCFPKPDHWAAYLRRSVVPLSQADASLIDAALAPGARTLAECLEGYLERLRTRRHRSRSGS